jgi:mannose-6-phosphate isomerase-like protein (cupin superfamily)
MKIEQYEYEGVGLTRVFENDKWMVGIKNWKPANDIENIDSLERHNGTDELFVLLDGSCTLLFANEKDGGFKIEVVAMEKKKVYNIPRTLWHNTVTEKSTKLLLVEDSATSSVNSDVRMLSAEERLLLKKLVEKSR